MEKLSGIDSEIFIIEFIYTIICAFFHPIRIFSIYPDQMHRKLNSID